jgi:ribosome biogenesis protein Nip4
MEKKITQENFEDTYVDSIELERIDKFVCDEMARQIHRYIKAMKGSKAIMLKFEEQLATLTVPEKEKAIARYIDLNRKVISGLDFKVVLARAMANYSDTFAYLVELVNNKRKMVFYLNRIREKYEQYHEVEHHLALVIHKLHEVGECVGVVSHGTCEHHLEIETRYHLAVQVDVAGDSLLLLGHGECSQLLLKLQHDSLRALHRLDIAVNLSRHLVAHELVYALQFDTVDISIFKVFLRYLLFHSNCYLSIYLGYTNQH